MSEKLRECPFCGGTAKVQRCYGFYKVYCTECKITNLKLTSGTALDSYETRLEAIEAWNTRAERTCKFEASSMNTAWDEDDNEIETGEVADEADMSCGNCGYPMMRDECNGWWDEEQGPYGGWFLKPRFSYCPKCGSKVIDWDGREAVS